MKSEVLGIEISKFPLGQLVVTANAQDRLSWTSIATAVQRHARGDWGEVDAHDAQANEDGLKHGDRLMSVYHDTNDTKFWIITEHDRSVTTVLLPEDY